MYRSCTITLSMYSNTRLGTPFIRVTVDSITEGRTCRSRDSAIFPLIGPWALMPKCTTDLSCSCSGTDDV